MKLKAAITEGTPQDVVRVMGSREFATEFLTKVVGDTLGAEDPLLRPAEFYVQKPDMTVCTENLGVELRLTGVSREGRTPAQFHRALKLLTEIAEKHIAQAPVHPGEKGIRVQLFVVIMLTGDTETTPGSGVYSNVLEGEAVMVKLGQ